jgi:predicted protein tyrosine phosphatase
MPDLEDQGSQLIETIGDLVDIAAAVPPEEGARVKVTEGHHGWADVVVVMEKRHKQRLAQKFSEAFAGKPCICLFIRDDYEFMEPALTALLQEKMREYFPELV